MANYVIMTDSNSEIPYATAKAHDLKFVPMPYVLRDEEIKYDLGENTDFKAFFKAMRDGETPKTNAYPMEFYLDFFRPTLSAGTDILFIAFSSALSAAFSYLTAAAEILRAEFPERELRIVNTLLISMGSGILVYYALQKYDAGASLSEIADWLEDAKRKVVTLFMVDDLVYLKRGGRVSATSALVGTMLNIKPVLTVDNEGRLVPLDKVKGRRKGIRYLADRAIHDAVNPEEQTLVILHGDCEEDALNLKDMITSEVKYKEVMVNFVGPVIGTHAGPGTLATVFMGEKRPR